MSLVMVAASSSGKVTGKLAELSGVQAEPQTNEIRISRSKPSHYHVLTVLLDIQDGRPLPSLVVILPLTSPQKSFKNH